MSVYLIVGYIGDNEVNADSVPVRDTNLFFLQKEEGSLMGEQAQDRPCLATLMLKV